MEIFVQSRGRSPDFEYCWQPEVPPQLSNISSLIQSESPSVVLARFQKRLMLLATGLDSLEKKDFRDRPIRHSIMWLFEEDYDSETQIRAIAVQALQGLLANQVDKYIQFGGESGFEVLIPGIEEMSRSFLIQEPVGTSPLPSSELPPKIGKNSQALRDDLAFKLQQYILPKGYELIVISTGIKSEESLEKTGAWRSLSNLVKAENWRNLSKSEAQLPNFSGAAIAIVAAIVVVALIILVVLLHPFSPQPEITPSPTPTTSPTQRIIEETSEILQNSLTNSPEPLKESPKRLKEVSTPSVNFEI